MRLHLILSMALAAAAPAAAHRGADAGSNRDRPSSAEAIRTMHKFATCVAGRLPERVERVLAMDYRTPEYADAMSKLAQSQRNCVNGKLSFNRVLMAGGMAEALLERGGTDGMADRLAQRDGDAPIEARDLTEFASLCAVRKAPGAVVALLATAPTSVAEETAMDALTPVIAGCVQDGLRAQFNRQGLRALLALAAYRIARTRAGNS